MKTQPFKEKILDTAPGGPMLAALLGTMLGLPVVLGAVNAIRGQEAVGAMVVLVEVACIVALSGLFVVNPNEGRVIQLFGRYVGTAREPGLRWANPFFSKRAVSLRLRSFESAKLKVNDLDGNPIEIADIIAWKVIDTAESCFQLDDYQAFVAVQTDAGVRNLATSYSYDEHDAGNAPQHDQRLPVDQAEANADEAVDEEGSEHPERDLRFGQLGVLSHGEQDRDRPRRREDERNDGIGDMSRREVAHEGTDAGRLLVGTLERHRCGHSFGIDGSAPNQRAGPVSIGSDASAPHSDHEPS